MDCMIQVNTLDVDNRNLCIVTSIDKIIIYSKLHLEYVQALQDKDYLVPLEVFPEIQTIRCGGIEIRNPQMSEIFRQKSVSKPLLEIFTFVPNVAHLTTEESIRINIQIIVENKSEFVDFKAIELCEKGMQEYDLLSPLIAKAIAEQPLIKGEIIILSNEQLNIRDTSVKCGKPSEEDKCLLVTTKNILSKNQLVHQCLKTVKGEYIISREPLNCKYINHNNLEILTEHTLEKEKLYLLRQKRSLTRATEVKIDNDNFSWLPSLKQALKTTRRIIMYAQNQPFSGIVGLYNCTRRELSNGEIRCVFVDSKAPSFSSANDFYKMQLNKDLAVNVYKDGQWGTYRHLPFDENVVVNRQHCFANITLGGDLSSLVWTEGPLTSDCRGSEGLALVYVYYAAVNSRDLMMATGNVPASVVEKRRTRQEELLGFEYSGRTANGKRVMGMSAEALSTILLADRLLMTEVPDEWSLEDAATVMVSYSIVAYAFKVRVNIRKGESVLIYDGSGEIGQAAIRVALYHGLIVYTTVDTHELREFLKQQFPELEDAHIGCSRNDAFEILVLKETKGRGVDYVLDSRTEDKLIASVRCVAEGGNFLQIRKCDLPSARPLDLKFFAKNRAFHLITLERILHAQPIYKQKILNLVQIGIVNGYVKPLTRHVFKKNQVAHAFKYMASGKHIGKIIIRIKKEESFKAEVPLPSLWSGIPRYFCDENQSYVITGGLGGFGMELADWLVLRGARNLVLSSRRGIKDGYQASRIRIWKSYGVNIIISTADITTKGGCVELIETANSIASVAAVFNLAAILENAMLENHTEEKFRVPFGPKASSTKLLDEITRELCPNLRDFVAFSSIACGRGYAGVTSYGMSNSIIERICEKRKADELPALAIQWGAIGEVGIIANMQHSPSDVVGGTLQQKLSSCFEVLDKFLRQPNPVVSSIIVAEKSNNLESTSSMTEIVKRILGIKDIKSVGMHISLAELGMDSIMAVEIQKSLQREYGVDLSLQKMRSLTFEKLRTLQDSNEGKRTEQQDTKNTQIFCNKLWSEELFLRPVVELESAAIKSDDCTKVFIIAGIYNSLDIFTQLASQIKGRTIYLQYSGSSFGKTVPEMGRRIYKLIKPMLKEEEKFILIAYSFGVLIALEVTYLLEKGGHKGEIAIIDGGTQLVDKLLQQNFYSMGAETINIPKVEDFIKRALITTVDSVELKHQIESCDTLENVAQLLQSVFPENMYRTEFLKEFTEDIYRKIAAFGSYTETPGQLQSDFVLCRPKRAAVLATQDYELSICTVKPVRTVFMDCNHQTILECPDVVRRINKLLCKLA